MNNYNFKVVAELKTDLTEDERKLANNQISELQRKLKIVKVNDNTYCKAGEIVGHDDFGAVTFFLCALEDMIKYLRKLEYYDYCLEEKHIVV